MPQRIKYIGPKPEKVFRGYRFVRDVSDTGENAVEVSDAVANEALAHPDVFLQWNRPVPERVKALEDSYPDALEREGAEAVKHWSRRLAVAETLPDDSTKQKQRKGEEIAGARRQVEDAMSKLRQAQALKAERRTFYVKSGLEVPEVLRDRKIESPTSAAELAAELARLQALLEAKDVELVNLRSEFIRNHEQQDADEAERQAEQAQGGEGTNAPAEAPAATPAPETPAPTGRPRANRRNAPAEAPAATPAPETEF